MKTKSLVHKLPGGIKTIVAIAALAVLFVAVRVAFAAPPSELLEKGIYTEETKGELRAASQIYQQIIDDPNASREIVAQAQLRLGLCELKQGNKPRAISALERLTQDFPDSEKLLSVVEQHMPRLLDDMLRQIEQNYIQEVDRSELMETALRAIIGKLDSRGSLLRTNDLELLGTNELAQMNISIDQKVAGIGARLGVDPETREVVVETPLADSPALRGGLRAGDRIVAVNGTELTIGKELEGALKLLRGEVGSPVTVRVKRNGSDEVREVKLVRDTIRLPSVLGDHRNAEQNWDFMLDDQRKIGYVRLTYLGKQSSAEMRAALDNLTARGLKALILDLRNAPGGLLSGAVEVSDLFVASGRIVTVKGRGKEQPYDAVADGTFSGFPMVVLVNHTTASAAEIIAACLQDHQRADVVGERTFGQGIVRSMVQLKGGLGALKLPVAAYYRPSGRTMNRYPVSKDSDDWGVTPDTGYEVAFTEEEQKQCEKYWNEREKLNNGEEAKVEFNDRQLKKALEFISTKLADQ